MAGDNRPTNVKSRSNNLSGFTKATGDEKPPDFLKPEGKKLWKKAIKELVGAGHLQIVDFEILALYCQAYANYIDFDAELREVNPIFYTENGYPVSHPLVKMCNDALEKVKNLGIKLNFNPDARIKNKVGIDTKKEIKDPALALIKKIG